MSDVPPAVPPLAEILQAVVAFVRRFVVVTADQAVTVALWVAHTHVIDAFDCTPYLQVTSATKRAGKTRLLEVIEWLVARAWLTQRVSAAALVRKVDAVHPTLLLDESDAAFKGDKEYAEALRGLLNSGYRRSGKATICVGQGAALSYKDFSTFCAKAIAGIGDLPDTVADRSIAIALRRRTQDEPCDRWRERDGKADATPIGRQLVAWADKGILEALRARRPELPTALDDRLADVWEPLLAIAELAGGPWPARARSAAVALAGRREDTDHTVELVRDVDDILATWTPDVIPTKTLLDELVSRDDRPWATWRKDDKPMTARGLAQLLGPLGIHSDRHETPEGRLRGYRSDAFTDAITRYLPSHVSKCPNPNKSGPKAANSKCPDDPTVDTSNSAKNPINKGDGTHGHIDQEETRPASHNPARDAAWAEADRQFKQGWRTS
jgi:hypothetical protein